MTYLSLKINFYEDKLGSVFESIGPVFEHQDGRLVDLDGAVLALAHGAVVDVGLLARRDAAVELPHGAPVQQLEDDHARARVHHLLHRRPVRLVLAPHLLLRRGRVILLHVHPIPAKSIHRLKKTSRMTLAQSRTHLYFAIKSTLE